MNEPFKTLEKRLAELGSRLAEGPSVVDHVMRQIDELEPPQVTKFNPRRIVAMLSKPRNLIAAAAVLALVVFGLRPWSPRSENGPGAWWLAPPSAWAVELQAAIDKAAQRGFTCQEEFINLVPGAKPSTSSTTSVLFMAGNRYRRDTYDAGQLRESQWYVQHPDGLTMTSVRYHDRTYDVTHDPAAQSKTGPVDKIEELAALLEKSGRRIGTARVEEREAVEFELDTSQLEETDNPALLRVWLDQATKMPLKISVPLAAGGGQIIPVTYVMHDFDWNAVMPAGTFEPRIPPGFSKAESK